MVRPPLVVDTATLAPADAARLRELVSRAGFFQLPAEIGSGRPVPDAFGYELAVTDDDRRGHTVSFDSSSAPGPLRVLVSALRDLAPSAGG
jgi:hypothetical protein